MAPLTSRLLNPALQECARCVKHSVQCSFFTKGEERKAEGNKRKMNKNRKRKGT
jgi:hypothetical protein